MEEPTYTKQELKVMELMAHGVIRELISDELWISPSKVARLARSAADKAGAESIVHGVAILVSQGRISVRHNGQRATAYDTALAWLDMKIHSCLDWQEFEKLRDAWIAMAFLPQEKNGENDGDR